MANTPLRADSVRCNDARACENLSMEMSDEGLDALTDAKHRALQTFYATPAPDAAEKWSAAMARYGIAERAYLDCASSEVVDDEKADQLCDIECDARWELIKMPAPDRPALLWKLEYLLQGSNGCLDPYNLESLSQVMDDCRRLLVEA